MLRFIFYFSKLSIKKNKFKNKRLIYIYLNIYLTNLKQQDFSRQNLKYFEVLFLSYFLFILLQEVQNFWYEFLKMFLEKSLLKDYEA